MQRLPITIYNENVQQLRYEVVEKTYPPGTVIIKEGDKPLGIFVVIKGIFNVIGSDGKTVIRQLKRGDFFGELSSLYGKPCTCTVSVDNQSECHFAMLPHSNVKKILLDNEPSIDVKSYFIKQGYLDSSNLFLSIDIPRAILQSRLHECPLFYEWSKEAVMELTNQLSKQFIEVHPTNTLLTFENESNSSLFLILEGTVELLRKVAFAEVECSGSCTAFCEENLLGNTNNMLYSSKVKQTCHCVTLHQWHFEALLKNYPIECAKFMEWKKIWQVFLESTAELNNEQLAYLHPSHVLNLIKEQKNFIDLPRVFLYEMVLKMDYTVAETNEVIFEIDSSYQHDPFTFIVLKGELAVEAPSNSDIIVKTNETFYLNPKFPLKTKLKALSPLIVSVFNTSTIKLLEFKYDVQSGF
eukprot:TCONS_00012920-protein